MPVILLIRHGVNNFVVKGRLAGRLPGVHLNEKGQQQARRLVELLGQIPIKAIYSSPLDRALETAAPLAETLGQSIIPHPGLQEVDFGGWQGKTLKQLHRLKLWKTVQQRPIEMRFPAGETFVEAQQRIVTALQEIAAQHDEKDLLICVSHSDAIKLAVAHFLEMPLNAFQRIAIDTASITVLVLDKERHPFFSTINRTDNFEWPKDADKDGKKPAE